MKMFRKGKMPLRTASFQRLRTRLNFRKGFSACCSRFFRLGRRAARLWFLGPEKSEDGLSRFSFAKALRFCRRIFEKEASTSENAV
jgi:hypothetical protein